MNRNFLATLLLSFSLVMAMWSTPAHAQGKPIDDEALSEVWGQALFTLDNTSANGYDFSRITINADIKLNANLSGIRLGEYTNTLRNGTGADIDISKLQLGTTGNTIKVTDPYIEFVYTNAADVSKREVVGMRLGFGGIQGDIGLLMNAVSGSLLINTASGAVDSRNDTLGGIRWDGTTCSNATACQIALAQIGAITAGDTSGPSRDFFVSVLKSAVQFPTNTATGTTPDTAQSGFWLNWRDRLTALNTTGTVPANTGKK